MSSIKLLVNSAITLSYLTQTQGHTRAAFMNLILSEVFLDRTDTYLHKLQYYPSVVYQLVDTS